MLLITILAGLAAGVCFAIGGYLQQRQASTRPDDESLSPRLLLDLARDRTWLGGIASTAGSFLFKSVALAFGPLSVVQPLVASELIFAIPPSVRRHGLRLHRREWSGIAAVTIGLAVGIYAANPHQGNPLPPPLRWIELLAALVVIAAVTLLIAKKLTGTRRAALYALAAVAMLVAQSTLLAATVALFRMGILVALSSWQTYAMGLASLISLTLVQSAYQAGPLAASMPIMDAVNPVLAIGVGLVVLGEHIDTRPWHLAGALIGVLLLVGGILVVDTSPLVRRVERMEHREQQQSADNPDAQRAGGRPGAAPGGDRPLSTGRDGDGAGPTRGQAHPGGAGRAGHDG